MAPLSASLRKSEFVESIRTALMFASSILTEHFAGRWPFWLSPRQVLVVPVMPAVNDYVREVQAKLRKEGLHADIDISGNTMQKKIRSGQLALYNFIFVVGAEERDSGTVKYVLLSMPQTRTCANAIIQHSKP